MFAIFWQSLYDVFWCVFIVCLRLGPGAAPDRRTSYALRFREKTVLSILTSHVGGQAAKCRPVAASDTHITECCRWKTTRVVKQPHVNGMMKGAAWILLIGWLFVFLHCNKLEKDGTSLSKTRLNLVWAQAVWWIVPSTSTHVQHAPRKKARRSRGDWHHVTTWCKLMQHVFSFLCFSFLLLSLDFHEFLLGVGLEFGPRFPVRGAVSNLRFTYPSISFRGMEHWHWPGS
jgi:hypothetical protein